MFDQLSAEIVPVESLKIGRHGLRLVKNMQIGRLTAGKKVSNSRPVIKLAICWRHTAGEAR
jgi:hypothetical protein